MSSSGQLFSEDWRSGETPAPRVDVEAVPFEAESAVTDSPHLTPYYQDDAVTIYHGDCREILSSISERVDVVLTDPPFFMPATHYQSRAQVKWQRSWGDTSVLGAGFAMVIDAITPRMKPSAHFLTFCDDESYPVFYPELYRRFDALASIVWDKGRMGMGTFWRHSHELVIAARWSQAKWTGGGSRSDVVRHSVIPSSGRVHPVDKPLGLLRELLLPVTDPGDLVVDPYMGGGSTLVAAKEEGRRAIGIETEERYCEVAALRCAQETLFGAAA